MGSSDLFAGGAMRVWRDRAIRNVLENGIDIHINIRPASPSPPKGETVEDKMRKAMDDAHNHTGRQNTTRAASASEDSEADDDSGEAGSAAKA